MGRQQPLRFTLLIVIAVATASVPFGTIVGAPPRETASGNHAAGFVLPARTVSLPIVMVREFPFVESEVNGIHGKLMLDTGARDGLILNDHRIPMPGARVIGQNFFGTGQKFVQRMNDHVATVSLAGGLRFSNIANVESQDATQLERITPDFIGWIGYDFLKSHAMELDYGRRVVTFLDPRSASKRSAADPNTSPSFSVRYELRRLPNHPIVPVLIGGEPFIAAFDTGQYGTIFADPSTRARLVRSRATTRPVHEGDEVFTRLINWRVSGNSLPAVPHLMVSSKPFAAARGLGISEPRIVTIGYGLLHRYRTIWDWRHGQITFYPR